MSPRYLPLLLFLAEPLLHAGPTYPDWWFTQKVVGENAPPAPGEPGFDQTTWDAWVAANQPPPAQGEPGYDQATYDAWMQGNYMAITQGQLLWMADRGIAEMDEQLAPLGGAGFAVDDLRDASRDADHYAVVVVGQLKQVASKFYDRLAEVGFAPGEHGWPSSVILNEGQTDASPAYPWLLDVTPDNFQVATLGQAKHLFSWELDQWTPPDPTSYEYDLPFVVITQPIDGHKYTTTQTAIEVASEAGFPGGVVSGVTFFIDGAQEGSVDSSSPYEVAWQPSGPNTFSIAASATDGVDTIISPEISVTVQADGDGDGLGDDWENEVSLYDPLVGGEGTNDADGDGLIASDEYRLGTDPTEKDNPSLKLILYSYGI